MTMTMTTAVRRRTEIHSHPDLACPITANCPWCNTWFYTISEVLATMWLDEHLAECNEGKRTMATAGPGRDAVGIDIGGLNDKGGWTIRCKECHTLLAQGEHPQDMTSQPVREAINGHTCTAKRSGRITED